MFSLLLVPLLLLLAVLFMYRFSGRREVLQLDLVQFLFVFVIYPIGYVWLKRFLYILIQSEIGEALTFGNWVAIETAFTIVFMYFYAFGIIHALTKTFSLNLNRDPLYDVFEDSKYFHEFLSHVGIFAIGIVAFTVLSLLNGIFPLEIVPDKRTLYGILTAGCIAGLLVYIGTFYTTDKGFQYSKYRRIMKLTFGGCFLLQTVFYFAMSPSFDATHGAYWFQVSLLTTTITSMFVLSPGRRFGRVLKKLPINGID